MSPFAGIRLFLPAIIPSWRFFDAVTASPRVEYAVLTAGEAKTWQKFRPRPEVLSLGTMLRRLLWNAAWNESLYLVSLAERLMSARSDPATVEHSQRELLLRIARHLDRERGCGPSDQLQIRLRYVRRVGAAEEVGSEIVYLSSPYPIAELLTR